MADCDEAYKQGKEDARSGEDRRYSYYNAFDTVMDHLSGDSKGGKDYKESYHAGYDAGKRESENDD